MNIYVGNLSPHTSERRLRETFARYGDVGIISLSEKPRDAGAYGFCFVEMPSDDQALAAISTLNGEKLDGYALTVSESGVSC